MSRRWLVTGAVAVVAGLALAAAAGWYLLLRDEVVPAHVADAVAAYREHEVDAGNRSPIPPGVYLYKTDGFERTDALGGTTHRYPAISTLTVIPTRCGMSLRWDVLAGRHSTWQICVARNGWMQQTRDEQHTFFGVGDRTTYRCTGTMFRPHGDTPGTTFPVMCITDDTVERGRGRVAGREQRVVAGSAVASVHIRTTTSFTGATRGSATYDFRLERDTGLPVGIVLVSRTTNGSPIGDVHYEENVSLALESLSPKR